MYEAATARQPHDPPATSVLHGRTTPELHSSCGGTRSRGRARLLRNPRLHASTPLVCYGAVFDSVLRSRPNPASRARTMACARSATWSLLKILETWFCTVFVLRTRCLAIAALLSPCAIK